MHFQSGQRQRPPGAGTADEGGPERVKEAVIGCDDVTERRRRDVGMQPRLWALGKELVEASRSA